MHRQANTSNLILPRHCEPNNLTTRSRNSNTSNILSVIQRIYDFVPKVKKSVEINREIISINILIVEILIIITLIDIIDIGI